AAGYPRRAAARAVAGAANGEAVTWLEQALEALSHLPESPEPRELAIDIRLELRWALFPLLERGPVLGHLREAERLATELDDQPRLGKISADLANEVWFRGDYAEAGKAGERGLAIGGDLGG